MLEETIKQYHERRKRLSAEEAGETQESDIGRNNKKKPQNKL